MDDDQLRTSPPTNLYWVMDNEIPLEEVLTEGRILASSRHDYGGEPDEDGWRPHYHWHRKILRTFDPEKGTVLLSHEGSLRLIDRLDEPDREYTPEELYVQDWTIRASDYVPF